MSIKIYFGVPGSGKTTLAAKIVHDNLKRGITTYSNVPIKGSVLFDASDIGSYDISGGEMILDEAGIQFNNRKFKELKQSTIEWFKLSRHYGISNIHVFSQSYDDMDITLRRLADEIYVVKRSILPYLFSIRRIKVKVGIDKDTHQIMDMYFFQFLGIKPYLGYHYWHMFDSWSAPSLPCLDWHYSSYDTFTIDKKHSKLIYKHLHKQGKIKYKIFHSSFCCRIINSISIFIYKLQLGRKINMKKSARIKTILCFVSQHFLKPAPRLKGSSEAGCMSGGLAPRATSATIGNVALPANADDNAAFLAFFAEHRDSAPEDRKPIETEKRKRRIGLLSKER